ncbi:hypothetical protein CH254_02265 [Rhodococcus sp. 06-412-2C]|uniref:hypothetical protein n=1 Tax=unclassified Rhodococcus (in: high G+C Gram-positive bacteria) TaxID=192944 RepID=UPI000B9C0715|nr:MULTISPECIES: hypothetical protein [unclassified Rhodococcus (in: high G+C Gram-positive bacteria)]OZC93473.1 hypothetical protein CH254_02265 [Rhodococcus sp. 06-412-2C]OZC95275.1 hypothetical protein CH279_18715 [Rhodococcus sp. 06-412-2B]
MTADEWLAEVMTRLPREGDDEKRAFATKVFLRAFGDEIFTADPETPDDKSTSITRKASQ